MARHYWTHSYEEHASGPVAVQGCQFPDCRDRATHQWQRAATEEEVAADAAQQGPYGSVVRNMQGPHRVAVFACPDHALSHDSMARTHLAECDAPGQDCNCHEAD